jgi:hypothetical protein
VRLRVVHIHPGDVRHNLNSPSRVAAIRQLQTHGCTTLDAPDWEISWSRRVHVRVPSYSRRGSADTSLQGLPGDPLCIARGTRCRLSMFD